MIETFIQFLTDNPTLRAAQGAVVLVSAFLVFFLFFAVRDILHRTHSFWYQALCIVLVAVLPIVGFLLYLLIRPERTLKERAMEAMLRRIMAAHPNPNPSSEPIS